MLKDHQSHATIIFCFLSIVKFPIFIPSQTKYRNHPVCSSVCPNVLKEQLFLLVDQYWWHLTQLQYTTWGCAWRKLISVLTNKKGDNYLWEILVTVSVCNLTHISSFTGWWSLIPDWFYYQVILLYMYVILQVQGEFSVYKAAEF